MYDDDDEYSTPWFSSDSFYGSSEEGSDPARCKRDSDPTPDTILSTPPTPPTRRQAFRRRKDGLNSHRRPRQRRRRADSEWGGRAMGDFYLEIFRVVSWILRKPLIYGLALWLVCAMLVVVYSVLAGAAVSSLCALPGVSLFAHELCEPLDSLLRPALQHRPGEGLAAGIQRQDFPKLMELQAGLEDVLDDSHGFFVFSWDMRHSETAVRDLRSLVKASKLSCKDILLENISEYIVTASKVSKQLSVYSGKVTGMADRVISADNFAIRQCEEVAKLRATVVDAEGGPLEFVWLYFARKRVEAEIASAERRMLKVYRMTFNSTEVAIQQLVLQGSIILKSLDDLDDQLNRIEDTVQHESAMIGDQEEDVLARMWTYLGGNRRQLNRMSHHKHILSSLSSYRKRALRHLTKTLVRLNNMEGGLKQIAEDVGTPLSDDIDVNIPIDLQIATIRRGAERLAESLQNAKGKKESYNEVVLQSWDTYLKRN